MTRTEFINKWGNAAIRVSTGTGLFPSLIMAQMIVESADQFGVPGNGVTAKYCNNFFGIKADSSWKGPKKSFATPKDGQPVNFFRVYHSPEDSIHDHTLFLQQNSRYRTNGVFAAKTPQEQARALAAAGYAEAKGYAGSLIMVMEIYHLYDLDKKKI